MVSDIEVGSPDALQELGDKLPSKTENEPSKVVTNISEQTQH